MPVAAWAIPTAVGAGLQIWGGQKQASAANKAADQQVASAREAKAELEPLYRESVARMDPYAQVGLGALGAASRLQGIPMAAPGPTPVSPGLLQQGGAGVNPIVGALNNSQPPSMMADDPRLRGMTPEQFIAVSRGAGQAGRSLASLGGGRSSYASPAPMPAPPASLRSSQLPAAAMPDGGSIFPRSSTPAPMPSPPRMMIRLQAPTGEVGEFSPEEASFYLQQGARRLS